MYFFNLQREDNLPEKDKITDPYSEVPPYAETIVSAVIMFFLEAAVLGYCIDRMAFLVKVSKYVNNWIRFVLYIVFAILPLILWCLSASTLICLGLFFLVGALNFILAIGIKADHSASYEKVTLSDLTRLEAGSADEVEDNEKTSLPTIKESET